MTFAADSLSCCATCCRREGCRAVRCPAMCRCAFGQWPGLCGACPTHDAKNPCKVTRITHEHSKTTINSSALLSSWLVHR
eukprot:scaffold129913_cov22-Tisochrysis_lutea.AAC.1